MIRDNVGSHKTDAVQTFLVDHPKVSIHYTPTYSYWLSQVENWFSRIQRNVIALACSHGSGPGGIGSWGG